MLRRVRTLRLLIAQEVDAFVEIPSDARDTTGVQRFHALCEKAEVATQPERLGRAPNGVSIYARNNRWIVNTARAEAESSQRIHALIVWDRRESEGQGRR